ncbi:hypothetical protein R1flu_017945 [Riccia fluitans]|uniref:Uncharacterized protein n=1 Tax=Riccia fluitans TaxID=41844 RepID=A0ABD1ZEE1_9MARC
MKSRPPKSGQVHEFWARRSTRRRSVLVRQAGILAGHQQIWRCPEKEPSCFDGFYYQARSSPTIRSIVLEISRKKVIEVILVG